MGIIANYVDNRINKILEERNLSISEGCNILIDEDYIKQRNKVFYEADTEGIYKFFKTKMPNKSNIINTHGFYKTVSGNIPLMHYPLANIISKTMVNLMFSEAPHITAVTGNKAKDKNINALITAIYDENNIKALLQKAGEFESYSGAVGFKPVLDPEFSAFPILIPYPKEDIEVVRKYDRITDIIFKDYYEVNKKKYVLCTICGKGYVNYKLYEYDSMGKNKKEVSLDTLAETAGLRDVEFYTSDGIKYNKLIAVYKENKARGESDYQNLTDDFQALDEVYSNMIDFIRKSKIKTYIPESMLQQNLDTGMKIIPSEYDSDYITLYDANPSGTNTEVKRDIVEVNNSLQGYQTAFNNILLNALSTAGLSPASIGLDIAGANSSSLALNIRERVSLRTRAEKLNRWQEALKELTKLVLDLYSINTNEGKAYIKEYDKDIVIEFMQYETPTYSEQVQTLGEALSSNLISLSEALKILYPDKSDADIEIMLMEIDGQLKTAEDIEQSELEATDNTDIDAGE